MRKIETDPAKLLAKELEQAKAAAAAREARLMQRLTEAVQKNAPPKRSKQGRPPKFNEALGAEICRLLPQHMSLQRVCKLPGMPSFVAVYNWEHEGAADIAAGKADTPKALFSLAFTRAKEMQAHAIMADCQDIADDGSNDWQEGEFGPRLNSEHVQRSRLRVETRMKLAERLNPRAYAPMQKMADADGGKLPATVVTPLIVELTTKVGHG